MDLTIRMPKNGRAGSERKNAKKKINVAKCHRRSSSTDHYRHHCVFSVHLGTVIDA
ncbi:uncharacterized protein G2W53_032830 [Senna tora]|uniref:Uncharacterized protein n=1 Tax=Senna tora TaxID=362788 RepID=A0A834SXE5_9FABA|nr:uncharacterized protein G2W53_032830 [Senna tora]